MLDPWVQRTLEAGLAQHRAGQFAQAEALYRQVLQRQPEEANALHLWGLLEHQRGRLGEAVGLLSRAVRGAPQVGEFAIHLASALLAAGRMDQALAAAQRAAQLEPNNPAALRQLGIVLTGVGRVDEAIGLFGRAVELRPEDAEYHYGLGSALLQRGRYKEALVCLRRSVELDPRQPESQTNLGAAYRALGKLDEAIHHYQLGLALIPKNADAEYNLGAAWHALAQVPEALEHFRRALALRADFAVAHSSLCLVMHYEAPLDARRVFEEHVRWDRQQGERYRAMRRGHGNERSAERRLRVGYVSPDLFSHSIGYFIEAAIAHHDRERFEVFSYSHTIHSDATTERLKGASEGWREIRALPDERVAQMIREDGIDILVDLSGHTSYNRLGVFAMKPAPVQVTYLGYPNTTGLRAIDYRLTDPVADPAGVDDELYVEKLVRLPRTGWCYTAPVVSPEVSDAPCVLSGRITFGSFNHLAKLNEPLAALWAGLLRRVAGSRLMLKAPTLQHPLVQQRVRERFARHGIGAEQLELVGFAKFDEHLGLYGRVDIALDTFPYNGTTTTCEAMWMGVPVVTLAGNHHVSRVGKSLLTQVGLGELIAGSGEEYISIAEGLARDIGRMRELRRTMRQRLGASALMDGAAFARDIEGAFRGMWRTYCAS